MLGLTGGIIEDMVFSLSRWSDVFPHPQSKELSPVCRRMYRLLKAHSGGSQVALSTFHPTCRWVKTV